MLVWDSRLVHCNYDDQPAAQSHLEIRNISRLALLICMTPRKLASPVVLAKRRELAMKVWVRVRVVSVLPRQPVSHLRMSTTLQQGLPTSATSHWPHEYREASSSAYNAEVISPAKLSAPDLKLFGLTDGEITNFLQQQLSVCHACHLWNMTVTELSHSCSVCVQV